MKIALTFLLIAFNISATLCQNFEKFTFDTEDKNGYYLAVEPKSNTLKGAIVLLPGFGQAAETIFPETKIHNVAYSNEILTIAIAGGEKLYTDKEVRDRLNKALIHVKEKFSIEQDKFVIGGFSAGGTIALRYAEYCIQDPSDAPIQPQAVFSIDSPVDLFNIWEYFQREIKKNYSEAGVSEAKYVSQIMISEIGTPSSNRNNYERLTPFITELEGYGNERFLKDIGVRVYHDVDVAWQLENRRRSLIDSNALAASELINKLLMLGNQRAEFMLASKPGYRSNGLRHPHSWSIVEEVELIKWVKEMLE